MSTDGINNAPNNWQLVKQRDHADDEGSDEIPSEMTHKVGDEDVTCGGEIPATKKWQDKFKDCRDELDSFNISATAYSNMRVEVESITKAGKAPSVGIRERFDTKHYGGQDGSTLANAEQGVFGANALGYGPEHECT